MMRTLRVNLLGTSGEDDAKLRKVWKAHAGRGRVEDAWRIVFASEDGASEDGASEGGASEGGADAELWAPVTSWVHWNALFAFVEAGGSGTGPDGLRVSSTISSGDFKTIPCMAYSLTAPEGPEGPAPEGPEGPARNVRLEFDEGDACDPWDVFAVRASPEISFTAALIHSALYARAPGTSLPEMAGEALAHFDNPAALFEQ